MDEFERLYSNEIFLFDSNNLENVDTRLYGFAFNNFDEIVTQNTFQENDQITPNGAYIYTEVKNDEIIIKQDFIGAYGIYLYRKGSYFAISNSFIKLAEYLKDKETLTFNREYAEAFLFTGLCSFAYGETLINEIEVLPRNYKLIINKKNNSINYEIINYQEHTVPLNSKEGLKTLDKWYNKWVNIIRSIKLKTNNISFDLSGGFDTRVVSALWLTSNIDFDNIKIRSNTAKIHVLEEDYEIASEISKKFGFKLNNDVSDFNFIPFEEIDTILNISFYPKLGFHKELYFRYEYSDKTLYSFTGAGGETIRGYPNETTEEYIEEILNSANRYDDSLEKPSLNVILNCLNKIKEYCNNEDDELPEIAYKEVRCRNHYGKAIVESFFYNNIALSPLIDMDLHKLKINDDLCDDKHLLIALIYQRYCPELLNFKFEGGRQIDAETINHAKKINDMLPFKQNSLNFISGPIIKEKMPNKFVGSSRVKFDDANDLIKKCFHSRSFEMDFKKYFPANYYDEIIKYEQNNNFYPLRHIYSAIAILKLINCTKSKIPDYSIDNEKWLKSFINEPKFEHESKNIENLLSKYYTARIDLKNFGTEDNSLEIIQNSDKQSKIHYETWFKNETGEGLVIQSKKCSIKLKIKCINDGNLKVWLRSQDFRDKENNPIPIFIDFTKLKINGIDYIEERKHITHDNYFVVENEVQDSDIITIEIEWLPLDF